MSEQTVAPRPWPHVGRTRRFGPVAVLLAAVLAAGTVATVHDRRTTVAAPGGRHRTGNPANNRLLPITYQMAKSSGTLAKYKWQTGCDRKTGRLALPTPFAPPCVPAFHANNGGATAPGVTPKTIRIVYYLSPPGDLTAALPNATDPPAAEKQTASGFVHVFDKTFELYGRKVVIIPYEGSGISSDAIAARADAIKVATELHAFASIGGPGQTDAYENQLAKLHVLCIGCGLSVPYATFKADAPYLWDQLPAPDTLLTEAFDFVVGQLLHKKAIYAGDPRFRAEKRIFGIVHYDQNPPVFGSLTATLGKEFGKLGLRPRLTESYLLNLSTLPQEASTIISKMKAAGVTTIVFAGDPIMPIYLTKAATAQNYFPEWVETGTVFTDSSTLARLYDPRQWGHAFGISDLAVPTPQKSSLGYSLWRWWYGVDPPAQKTPTLIAAPLLMLFTGIQLAGPHLTGQTFEGGEFRFPPTGGDPTNPLEAYGYHGAPPLPSYATPDDYTVIWFDPTAKGPDEEGAVGSGLYRYPSRGLRYRAGVIPHQPIPLFSKAGTVTSYPQPLGLHSAPPWPGSPAAARPHSSTS